MTVEKPISTYDVYTDLFEGIAQSMIEEVTVIHFDCNVFRALQMMRNKILSRLTLTYGTIKDCLGSYLVSPQALNNLIIFGTDIERIPPVYFPNTKGLVELDLNNNKIHTLSLVFLSHPLYEPWI